MSDLVKLFGNGLIQASSSAGVDGIEAFEGRQLGDWVWCLHCGRTYRLGWYRLVDDLQMCPYPDCSGDTVMDACSWEEIRKGHPDYPVQPVLGQRYSEY